MTREPVSPAESSSAPDTVALAKVVARQRAEMDRLRDQAAQSAVVEQAKGVVMAQTRCTPDAAEEELQRRAETEGHSLLEECWLTLGSLAPAPVHAAPEPDPVVPAATAVPPPEAAADDAGPVDLGPLGRELVRVATSQDLARCLLDHLAPAVDADAVMIYSRLPTGGLELVGHAGVDDTLAAQWQQVPPLSGIAVLDALRAGEPLWLEDVEADRERYLLSDPPERWRSRAWLPVPNGDSPDVCIGVLRSRVGPFSAHIREHLQAVARLCAGRLLAFATRPEDTADASATAVQAVFDALSGAAMLLAPLSSAPGNIEDYRIDAATEETVDVVGRAGRELLGRRFRECCPALAGEPMWQGLRRTLVTGNPYESEPFGLQELVDGIAELFTYTVQAARLGEKLVVTWVRHSSSDRQEQRLADLQRLGGLGWASWNLVTHEVTWSSQVFALFDRDPAHGPVGLTELPDLALPEDGSALRHAIGELLVEGRTFDVPFRVRRADGLRHLRAVAEAVPDSSGTTVEVHGVIQDLTAQRSAELALVESERAMLTQHDVLRAERTLAGRLQDTLLPLPTRPVRLAGLRVEVAYLPAQSGVHVGGDWFSVVELPDGDAVFVVGDVAGHGLDAVATMALLRFTAKGMVITGSSLTGALARLNTLLLHSRDSHGTATLILARYHPAEHRLVWAQAGHPPPLLVRDGEARFLERPRGMLLGASPAPVYAEAECRLEPGDRVILYTDGLVERPAEGIDRGLQRLSDAVLTQHTQGPDSLPLGPLLASMLEGEHRDDVCVLDIRAPLEPAVARERARRQPVS
ncbi:serine phosphatase RsbU (regulator of sigma subunit) [Streptomyces sp. VMFN-G11Ma]|nr:serine phosphatase RsbU (regulator of sigma subunit) [Streptomyces sp. VMFN-G11Ma]